MLNAAAFHVPLFPVHARRTFKACFRETTLPGKLFQNPIKQPKHMQRYNSFNQIHKALRALLYDAALSLQQTDFIVKSECDAAVEKVVAILDLFEEHAHNEDTHVLPAVFSFEPSIVDAFEQEHVQDLELSRALHLTIAELYRATAAVEKQRLGRQLTIAFIQFMVFNLNHMAKEEEILNEILWRYYSDDEIKNIEAVIRQNAPADRQPFVVKWMLRGISNSEAVNWLKGMQQQLPAPVFEGIIAIAEAELPASRFQQITAQLAAPATLA